eukprot:8932208-Alexandrium_andersonii.AAC.1
MWAASCLGHVPVPGVDALACQPTCHLQAAGLRAVPLGQGSKCCQRHLCSLDHLLEALLVGGGCPGPGVWPR